MSNNTYIIPGYITGNEIKNVRKKLKMTQKEFALFASVSKPTVERWEREEKVSGPIVSLIEILKRDLSIPEKFRIPEKKYKLRLYYMFENTVCTIIDIDEVTRSVSIKNYINNPQFRAFGINTEQANMYPLSFMKPYVSHVKAEPFTLISPPIMTFHVSDISSMGIVSAVSSVSDSFSDPLVSKTVVVFCSAFCSISTISSNLFEHPLKQKTDNIKTANNFFNFIPIPLFLYRYFLKSILQYETILLIEVFVSSEGSDV